MTMTDSRRALAVVVFILQIIWFRADGQTDSMAGALDAFLHDVWPSDVVYDYNTSDPCHWPPVKCDSSNKISRIDLQDKNLTGEISNNTLSGLTELVELNLSKNHLTGHLTELSGLSKLKSLDLSRNNFSGNYPVGIGNLNHLSYLDLSGNDLTGRILDELVNLRELQTLDLSNNRFVGDISTLFRNRSNLVSVNLSHNNFSGSIPNDVCDPQQLKILHLGSNSFTGPMPNSITSPCNALQSLDLSSNRLSGNVPDVLHQIANLETLDLSGNQFDGSIPPSIFRGPNLKVLYLHKNNFSGPLSVDQTGTQSLLEINLESNGLSGTFPRGLLDFHNLTTLKLGNNRFSGSLNTDKLPPANATSLQELDLHNNQLSGELPDFEAGLLRLDFSSNEFNGSLRSVPVGLQKLDVHDNQLIGDLSMWISLSGSLEYLDLSSNLFSGDFPSDFTNLTNLTRLALADNQFSLHAFPELRRVSKLESLNLSGTNLSGTIPASIGELNAGLRLLDLSRNDLTGEIPPEMGNLTRLMTLDLSHNGLTGEIPKEMTNLTDLSRLDLSNNNLSGMIPEANQWLTFPNTSFLGNPLLCSKHLLNITCPEPQLRSASDDDDDSSKRTVLTIALVIGLFFGFLMFAVGLLIWCRVSRAVKPLLKDETTTRQIESAGGGTVFLEKDPEAWAKEIKDPHTIPVVMFEKPLLKLTLADLLQATANFNREVQIADGGYGPVYRAVLTDGTQLAIKILVEVKFTDAKDAVVRIEALADMKHPNLVALVGYCLVGDNSLLIYEYMVNGDLQRWLHELPEGTRNPEDWSRDTWEHMEGNEMPGDFLDWPSRHKIALGTARALSLLHHGCSPHVVHLDVKSSNILLDESFEAHLVDCGLAGIVKPTTPIMGGTVGYVPPEYGQTWQATPRGDVYSFGVVLLELVTGRKPIGHYFHESYGGNLVGWVRLLIKDNRGQKALDPKLASRGDVNQMLEVLRVGYLCTADAPAKRPTMQQVVGLLKDCQPGP